MRLLFFKVDQLGDNVICLPLIQTLRRLQPEWQTTVFTTALAAPLYQADVPPERLAVIPRPEFISSWKKPWRHGPIWSKALGTRATASLIADQLGMAHLLSLLSGARIRIGSDRERPKFRRLLSDVVPLPAGTPAAMICWKLGARLMEILGIKGWPEQPPPPDLSPLLDGATPEANHVLIHPGASVPCKRWFPERYVQLANRLSNDFRVTWIAQDIAEEVFLDRRITRLHPSSLTEFIRVLGTAQLFVGNNSGPMNIAVALGRPSVILNGPSHSRWNPFWHADRISMLRDTTLPCLPCDTELLGARVCKNEADPMACMRSWTVDKIERHCREWAAQWPVRLTSI